MKLYMVIDLDAVPNQVVFQSDSEAKANEMQGRLTDVGTASLVAVMPHDLLEVLANRLLANCRLVHKK